MQIPLEPTAAVLGLVGTIVMGRGFFERASQSAADSRPPDSSAFTNPLGHDHRRIVIAQEARADYFLGLLLLVIAAVIQCASAALPSISPDGVAGWFFTLGVPMVLTATAWWSRPRLVGHFLERIAAAQNIEVFYMSGNPAPSQEHRSEEMRMLLHRAVNDERLRALLQKRWAVSEFERRSYSHIG